MFMLRSFVIISIISSFTSVYAQQDPLYALYLNNPIVINPAYSGSTNIFEGTAGYRNQWAGFDGNPKTYFATAQTSLMQNKMGAGFQIIQDKIGENSNTTVNASLAYKIAFDDNKTLSFGMQAGVVNFRANTNEIALQHPDDPAFALVNTTKLNIGSGLLFKSDRVMLGLSVPRMLNASASTALGDVQIYQRHYYAFASYAAFLSDRIILKPAVLLKAVNGAPLSADINVMLNIDRKIAVGAYTRNLNAYGILAQLFFLDKFKAAYAFEVPTNKSVGTRFVTHELMLGMRLAIFESQRISVTEY